MYLDKAGRFFLSKRPLKNILQVILLIVSSFFLMKNNDTDKSLHGGMFLYSRVSD